MPITKLRHICNICCILSLCCWCHYKTFVTFVTLLPRHYKTFVTLLPWHYKRFVTLVTLLPWPLQNFCYFLNFVCFCCLWHPDKFCKFVTLMPPGITKLLLLFVTLSPWHYKPFVTFRLCYLPYTMSLCHSYSGGSLQKSVA